MENKKFKSTILLLILSTLTLASISAPHSIAIEPSEPNEANAMWIEPSLINLNVTEISIGYKFNLTVFANVSVATGGWQFWIIYENSYLNATGCGYTAGSQSEFYQGLSTLPVTPSFKPYNATHNRVEFGEIIMLPPYRDPGYGSLAWIEFEVINLPETTTDVIIAFADIGGIGTYILDQNGAKIDLSAHSAKITFLTGAPPPPPPPPPPAMARIFIAPPEIIDPTMLPSSTFAINVTIENVTDLKTCIFNLTYNSLIIGWAGMDIFKIEDQMPIPTTVINDEKGYVWVQLTYPNAIAASDPEALLRIEFHVKSMGATPLNLSETELLNSQGEQIEHEAIDGYFATLIRDLAILDLSSSQDWAYQGWTLTINVTVKNNGNIEETFTVKIIYGTEIIENITVTNLPSEATSTLSFEWNTENVAPCSNYTLKAEIDPVPYEVDTTNNHYEDDFIKIRLFGDVNGDGYVGIDDINETAIAFGSYPNHPRWNVYADLNQDNYVGVDDVFAVATHFGSECQ